MRPNRPSLLMVTAWARKGGAERLIVDLLDRVRDDVRAALGFVRPVPEKERTLEWDGPTVGLREILFGRWDLIHTHLFLPGLLVRIRRMWDGGFRWVHTVHYEDYELLRWGRLKKWLDRRFVFPATDVLVAVSSSSRAALDRFPQTRLIENAIDLEPADEATGPTPLHTEAGAAHDEADSVPSGPVVGTVARLRPEKGLDDLVEAIGRLRDRFPDLRLRIAGDGELRPALEKLTERLGLDEQVELCGFVDDLDAFYRSLDVYVQPSRTEQFGLAALESMRYSLPLIASGVGFLPEMLGHGRFGELVPREGDVPGRLARALERVLEDRDTFRRRARKGLEHWRPRVSPDRMEEEYREAYRSALEPRVCMVQPIVTHSYGGLARQLHLQSRELSRRGHRVFVIQRTDPELRTDPGRRERWSHAEIRGAGRIGKDTADSGGVGARLRGLRFVMGALIELWRIRNRVDVVHAHQLYSPTLVGALGKLFFGKPLVSKVTSSGELGERSQLRRLPFRRLRLLAFRAIDRVLVLTPAMAEEMEAIGFGPATIRLVPNSVAPPDDVGDRSAGTDPESDEPYRILFTGRLSTEKSLDTLLRAGAVLADRDRTLRIDLVGGADPDRDATPGLRDLAGELPPGCRVRFLGFREDVDRFYRESDAFVLPSATEGLSNALLEAMAWGLPCVVSDIPPNRFAVDGGEAGLLFRQGDPESLARVLERLLGDRDDDRTLHRRLSEAARERARRRFSVDSVVDRLEEIYDDIAAP